MQSNDLLRTVNKLLAVMFHEDNRIACRSDQPQKRIAHNKDLS